MEKSGFVKRLKDEAHFIYSSFVSNREWPLAETGQFWDSVADYDDINGQAYSYFRRFTDGYDMCSIPPNSKILDICARTGNGTRYFYDRGLVKHAVCADVSRSFMEICGQQLAQYHIPFEQVLVNDYQLPQPDESFDAILCFETLEHVSKPQEFLVALRRVLKQKGEIIITTPNVLWEPIHWLAAITGLHHSEGPHRFIRRRKLLRLLKEAHFSIIIESTTVLIPGGPAFLIRLGEFLESIIPESVKRIIGLRRIFICTTEPNTEQQS
jgi:2-polyprenyl-3-methyl-5-hydroxy-6-metoxy-1,4-benzoquinol methylase